MRVTVIQLLFSVFFLPTILGAGGPEQVHIAVGKDVNSMVINWVTQQPAGTPQVQYGPQSPSQMQDGTTVDFEYNGVHKYMHTVTLTNLLPATVYYYKVGSTSGWSQQFQFKTFPSGNNFQFRVCVFGDLGYLNGTSLPFLIDAAEKGDFDMVVHVGDIAYDLHTDNGERGDLYMQNLEPLASRVPYMVVAGNHEDDGKNFSHYQNRFTMPGYDNQFYSFEIGPVHFVTISTEYYGYFYEYGHQPVLNQYSWLQGDLQKADSNRAQVPWIVGFQHRPFYCSNDNSFECAAFENTLVRTGYEEMPGLEPVLTQYSMDLAFWGHEHSYERFLPVNNRTVYNGSGNPYHNAPAPTYVVSGSAGCHTPKASFGPPNPASAFRSDDFGYSLITVYNHTHINVQQISVEKGGVIDEIWLIKDLGHKMTSEGLTGTPFPPAELGMKCSFRDTNCRREAEKFRSIRFGGLVP
ncbi:hypothetical protein FO519_005146 [Halicephalobus sp. NKZ332]|nr:hypothetical protein FO519_005146 [Halicephalobus sp. NKZ332]